MSAAAANDPLAVLDDLDDPIDDVGAYGNLPEQDKVIAELQRRNEKSHFVYRAMLLVLYGIVCVLYVSPIPAYLAGTHHRMNHTLFMRAFDTIGTESDLTHVPAFPIYCALLSFYAVIVYLALRETLFSMGYIKPTPKIFPAQPHLFGTAPDFIVPFLRDLRVNQVQRGRADLPEVQPLSATISPRVLYIALLWIVSWPVPLLTFGAGAFEDSFWWSITSFVLAIHVFAEYTIQKAERETVGLNGLKYTFKSA